MNEVAKGLSPATAAAATAATAAVTAGTAAVAGASVYGYRYISERVRWNDEAKERVFKHQFVAHVTKKRRPIVDSTTANCSNQVDQ